MKKSCQDLEKNLGKIFSRSCKNLARNQAIQEFRMDLEQESCKIRKILASSKSWHGFGTDFLPICQILKHLGKILQDIFDRHSKGCFNCYTLPWQLEAIPQQCGSSLVPRLPCPMG